MRALLRAAPAQVAPCRRFSATPGGSTLPGVFVCSASAPRLAWVVGPEGLEPSRALASPRDFKSPASASSATAPWSVSARRARPVTSARRGARRGAERSRQQDTPPALGARRHLRVAGSLSRARAGTDRARPSPSGLPSPGRAPADPLFVLEWTHTTRPSRRRSTGRRRSVRALAALQTDAAALARLVAFAALPVARATCSTPAVGPGSSRRRSSRRAAG